MSREYTRRISVVGNVPSHGPFIFFDDFEDLLKWTRYNGVGDYIYELDPTIAYSGNQSLYIKSRTTGASEDDIIGTRIQLHMTSPKKLNQAMHFRSPVWEKIKKLQFYHTLDDAATLHTPTIQYLPNVPKWQYFDTNNVAQDIPGATYRLLGNAWHRLQLLADLNSDKYISMMIDSRYYDLSAFSLFTDTPGTGMYLDVIINTFTMGAEPSELYIDDFLIHEL